jgi:hypothetical protein
VVVSNGSLEFAKTKFKEFARMMLLSMSVYEYTTRAYEPHAWPSYSSPDEIPLKF